MRSAVARIAFLVVLVACAADRDQLTARVASQNASSHADAERAFFAKGHRPLTPAPTKLKLRLRDVDADCTLPSKRSGTDPVEVLLGEKKGVTTFEAACAVASRRRDSLSIRLDGETGDTLVTRAPPGELAVTTSGKVIRYMLVPQVKENQQVFEKGVSCCCSFEPSPRGDASLEVIVGPSPATEEVIVPYDITTVTFCDPAAPQ